MGLQTENVAISMALKSTHSMALKSEVQHSYCILWRGGQAASFKSYDHIKKSRKQPTHNVFTKEPELYWPTHIKTKLD